MANRNSNPNNPQHSLFRKLTKLLSGPINVANQQNPRRSRRIEFDKYASRFRKATGQSFKKTEYGQKGSYTANYMANQNRAERYHDFDQMEYMPELASALDIYADEITTSSELTPLLNIKTHDEEIKLGSYSSLEISV